jgi:hypothetical protein
VSLCSNKASWLSRNDLPMVKSFMAAPLKKRSGQQNTNKEQRSTSKKKLQSTTEVFYGFVHHFYLNNIH